MNIFSLGLASTRPRSSPDKFESHTSARKPRLDQVIPFLIGTESAKCGPVAIEVEALEKFSRIPGPRQSTSRQRIAFARAENDDIEEVFTCGNPSYGKTSLLTLLHFPQLHFSRSRNYADFVENL